MKAVLTIVAGAFLVNICNAETVTYEFTAKITDNGGVEYFAKGTEITGSFTYDKSSRPVAVPSRADGIASYPSPKSKISFSYQGHQFVGKEEYLVIVNTRTSETFSFRALDIQLPEGWKIDHSSKADGYGLFLQNSRWRGVLRKAKRPPIPETLDLSQFDTCEVTLNFGNGVKYPQGGVGSRATVRAKIISMKSKGETSADQSKTR